ncbi:MULTISPECIES: hypothetical protein [unclassified Rhizobium]|uniref:hypothetical protein n=1 Tax=unclassified Rhizobium TaxID=2613769 RepID=UPI00247A069F|nr:MULTISPECIES: hypothetical protein [unclassified Rhizobium]MDH7802422.1 hypothetical protein [Rhizobium sp. AN70]
MTDGGGPQAVMLASSEAMVLESLMRQSVQSPYFDSVTEDVHVIWLGISGDVEFIQEGLTKSCGPKFVDMTPQDEASIRECMNNTT